MGEGMEIWKESTEVRLMLERVASCRTEQGRSRALHILSLIPTEPTSSWLPCAAGSAVLQHEAAAPQCWGL